MIDREEIDLKALILYVGKTDFLFFVFFLFPNGLGPMSTNQGNHGFERGGISNFEWLGTCSRPMGPKRVPWPGLRSAGPMGLPNFPSFVKYLGML